MCLETSRRGFCFPLVKGQFSMARSRHLLKEPACPWPGRNFFPRAHLTFCVLRLNPGWFPPSLVYISILVLLFPRMSGFNISFFNKDFFLILVIQILIRQGMVYFTWLIIKQLFTCSSHCFSMKLLLCRPSYSQNNKCTTWRGISGCSSHLVSSLRRRGIILGWIIWGLVYLYCLEDQSLFFNDFITNCISEPIIEYICKWTV